MKIQEADWLVEQDRGKEASPIFQKKIKLNGKVKRAVLWITALGVYEAHIDGERVGKFIMAPGWTSYKKRLQVQEYDVTNLFKNKECANITVALGNGWCVGRLVKADTSHYWSDRRALLAFLQIEYEDGRTEEIKTDQNWEYTYGSILFSEIYDGETYDSRISLQDFEPVNIAFLNKDNLIMQEGEEVCEMEEIAPIAIIKTKNGETVLDFGQNFTGYVRFHVNGRPGEYGVLMHGEILDKDGNFYNENMRTAKNKITFICNGKEEIYNPHFSFQGFRYVRVEEWPEEVKLENFKGIAVYSNMKRRGTFSCSSPLINRLYENVIWGQKSNFLDVPTDCPQRDERLGWTGDAQVFAQTAANNFFVERFFKKWLTDLAADQFPDGGVPHIIPDVFFEPVYSSGWGDAAVICPWVMYLMYGNSDILEKQYSSMRAWIDYIRSQGSEEALWNSGYHFGDWLALDAKADIYVGSTDLYLIATAYFYYSTCLFVKAGKVLQKDMQEYEELASHIRERFQDVYIKNGKVKGDTQTADVLSLYFDLADDKKKVAAALAKKLEKSGGKLTTGFIGTPYLLFALADNGYEKSAYSLLLEEDYPSWLYSVKQGATTIWEHWDGMKTDGTMWSTDMNSFNHYAYGAVAQFLYERVAGIRPMEEEPGFKKILFAPIVDERLSYANAGIEVESGTVKAGWERKDGKIYYQIEIPSRCKGVFRYKGEEEYLAEGQYQFIL